MNITTDYFENETYSCNHCSKELKEEQVNKATWCCDDCNSKISIDIGIKNHTKIVRLHPNEMTVNDFVFDQYSFKFHDLKGISSDDQGIYKIGIKEYRQVKIYEDEFVNCMWNNQ